LKRHKVLIVDDSPVALEGSAMILEEAGFEVKTLGNPLLIPFAMHQEKPRLLLVDLNMPTLDGATLVKILGDRDPNGRTKVVLYSDAPKDQLRKAAHECGADGYVRKTNDAEELVSQVRSFVEPSSNVS